MTLSATIPTPISHLALEEVAAASRRWIAAFNLGDVDTCVATYLADAEMLAAPMGRFQGHAAIDGFWRPFVAGGAGDLAYHEVQLSQQSDGSVFLSARWTMNVGAGVIYKERWQKDEHGVWRLAFDHFEVKDQYGA